MKKLLLSMGSIAAVVTPVVAVVSCGKKEEAAQATNYKATAITAIDELVGKMDQYDSESGTPSVHLKFASVESLSSSTTAEAVSNSSELLFYKQSGAWHTSHSANFALPFYKNTGIWTMKTDATLNEAAADQGLASKAALASFKTAHSDKTLTLAEVKGILGKIKEAIQNEKLAVANGDTIVFNHIKIDRDFYHTGKPETDDNKVTIPNHLDVTAGSTDHKYL